MNKARSLATAFGARGPLTAHRAAGSLLTGPGCRVNRKYPLRASVFAARKLDIKRSDGLMSHEAPVMMNPAQSLVSRSGTLKEATRS